MGPDGHADNGEQVSQHTTNQQPASAGFLLPSRRPWQGLEQFLRYWRERTRSGRMGGRLAGRYRLVTANHRRPCPAVEGPLGGWLSPQV